MAEQVFPRITRLVGRVESSIDTMSNPIYFHGDLHPFVYSTYPHPPTDEPEKMEKK
jgi:hypothetical protein